MIHYLRGTVEYIEEKFFVVGVAGLGYRVFCAVKTLKNIAEGQEIKIFTYLFLKDDAAELYGFLTREELELFETLNSISGIGPKTAMMLASLGSLEKLKDMMESGKLPPEIKGIGQKRMQKILLELTGKIKEIGSATADAVPEDALKALVSLGFPIQKAKQALSKVSSEISDSNQRVQAALRILGGH